MDVSSKGGVGPFLGAGDRLLRGSQDASVASPGASLRQIVTCDKIPGDLSTGYPQLNAITYILSYLAMIIR
jgi:hypothetical protein